MRIDQIFEDIDYMEYIDQILETNLPVNAKMALLLLSLYRDGKGQPINATTIAKKGGMGVRTAFRVLAALKTRGLITDDRRVLE